MKQKTVDFSNRLAQLNKSYCALVSKKNIVDENWNNGWYSRFKNPVLTADHIPLHWRYDLNPSTNPFLLERLGINVVLNSGAIEHNGKVLLVARVEGYDRKSFFALADSDNGIDNFRFIGQPILIPQTSNPDVNTYDMRLTKHEDGWIYGFFCTERKKPDAPAHDMSTAMAACGIVRTKDFTKWERLDDLKTVSPQQRNVVLHPEFINGKYGLYTRPQDDFMDAVTGGGIGWALCDNLEHASISNEIIMDPRVYHTIKEFKNGQGPTPVKTEKGWLHIAHGVRNTAAGMRYILYAFLSDINEPWKITHRPGGHFIAPLGEERVGDVSNVVFANGMVARDTGDLLIYYASSDTRLHVAKTSIDVMLDYVMNTPEDPLFTYKCVTQRRALIDNNVLFAQKSSIDLVKQIVLGRPRRMVTPM